MNILHLQRFLIFLKMILPNYEPSFYKTEQFNNKKAIAFQKSTIFRWKIYLLMWGRLRDARDLRLEVTSKPFFLDLNVNLSQSNSMNLTIINYNNSKIVNRFDNYLNYFRLRVIFCAVSFVLYLYYVRNINLVLAQKSANKIFLFKFARNNFGMN